MGYGFEVALRHFAFWLSCAGIKKIEGVDMGAGLD
jgi:hypothetical protein